MAPARNARMAESQSKSFLVDARPLLKSLRQLKRGDFSARMPLDEVGLAGEVAEAFNEMADLNQRLVDELEQLSTERLSAMQAGGGHRP
jgi:methyl-accepting chemotaxis protein